ncbi:hypothetical protein BJ165DRAFT_1495201 [Panaeolus papilionaceus]|nr:hypothetical protein BJ165DRAFT_1495201 [Panaeolus papilionaceus]
MPSFAELKAKASKTTSSGVEKMQNVRDRNTSVPLKKTNWDPYSGAPPPPPPPPRSLVNRNTKPALSPLLPPPSRTSNPASPSLSRAPSVSPAPALPARSFSSASSASVSANPPPPLPSRGNKPATFTPPVLPSRSPSVLSSTSMASSLQGFGPPPPVKRDTRPTLSAHSSIAPRNGEDTKIDWINISAEDKEVFFSWLDEFFANFSSTSTIQSKPAGGPVVQNPSSAPPPVRYSSKPVAPSYPPRLPGNSNSSVPFITPTRANPASRNVIAQDYASQGSNGNSDTNPQLTLSYPPPNEYGSAAHDVAHYFLPSVHWDTVWFESGGGSILPPCLKVEGGYNRTCSWMSVGSQKTAWVGIYFPDLSIFWGTVEYITPVTVRDLNNPNKVKRSAQFLPPPEPLGRAELVEAHETYGETIALFAESFEGTGEYCARGECWDLANEALKYFAQYDYIPKPVPSTNRTHGHLIYFGRASHKGASMEGCWRGGDDRIRRGDIIEWHLARVGMKGAMAGGYCILGAPDHTAVIVEGTVPSPVNGAEVVDGMPLKPCELGTIVVVEQSVGSPPIRREYALDLMEEGEVWVYRPISMKGYIGIDRVVHMPPEEGIPGRKLQQL